MKTPDFLIIASTQTGEGKEMGKEDIIAHHTNSRSHGGLGLNRPGFDYLVPLDGSLQTILPEGSPNEVDLFGFSDGVNGISGNVKILAYVGGMTEKAVSAKDTRTATQKDTMKAVVSFYVKRFPGIRVLGWDQVPSKKDSNNPGFDVPKWLESIAVSQVNIYQS